MVDEPAPYDSTVNNHDPAYAENWFLALWAYNTGLHAYADRNLPANAGYAGLGWINNPANPDYTANREGFMRATTADAEHPNLWSYPERIMGWIETPQGLNYDYPVFGGNQKVFYRDSDHLLHPGLTLPGLNDFCDADFGCTPGVGCPAVNSSCYWHGDVNFADCANAECATERLAYTPGADAEPGVQRTYGRDCTAFDPSKLPDRDTSKSINMVYTLDDTNQYNLGCDIPGGTLGGKFALRGGSPSGQDGAAYANFDLRQLGAGYMGHIYFTHGAIGNTTKHRVVGAWTPDLPLGPGAAQLYNIIVHIPSHGATWHSSSYLIERGARSDLRTFVTSCTIDDDTTNDTTLNTDQWINLGTYLMGRGAQVVLTNESAPTDADVGYDAMAFVPMNAADGTCGQQY
jgi:hypothetical protein